MPIPKPPRGARIIEAHFLQTTPAYLRGASGAPEVRCASFKALLRYWWRALKWADFLASAEGDVNRALRNMHIAEAQMFGLASGDERGGQGAIRQVHVAVDGYKVERAGIPIEPVEAYLAGMGLAEWDGAAKRFKTSSGRIAAGALWKCTLLLEPTIDTRTADDLAGVMQLLGSIGGIGARSRRGFGSLAIVLAKQDGAEIAQPSTLDTYGAVLNSFTGRGTNSLPPHTALSAKSDLSVVATAATAAEVLQYVGGEMMMYRSFGRLNGGRREVTITSRRPESAEQNFEDDHDEMARAIEGHQDVQVPLRAAFGLPHNYKFSGGSSINVDASGGTTAHKIDRRASPLLIHVHRLSGEPNNEQYCCTLAHLPAKFLPDGASISISPSGQKSIRRPLSDLDRAKAVIPDFLDRFNEEGK